MKTGACGLFLILLIGVCQGQYPNNCSLNSPVKDDIHFPDISKMAIVAYQLAVDFTMSSSLFTDFYIEYYNKIEKKGRLDYLHHYNDTRKYYYYTDGLEAFETSDTACSERNETNIPYFMKLGVYEWYYNDAKEIIHGPSAMFKIAYEEDQKDHSKVVYMGESEDVRGIPAQYWRRCAQKNLTVEYYFSTGVREGVYGVKNLTFIPLRVKIYGALNDLPEGSKIKFPQNYEIMTYTPFLEDPRYTFELPVGLGCGRKPREDDNEIPNFEKQSLYIEAEAVYTDYITGSPTSYISEFTFAFDIDSEYLSYFYTPWTTVDGQKEASTPISVVYDTKHKYVYNTSYSDGSCKVESIKKFIPKYSLPGDKGYVSLTDPSVFYPNNEFYYLGEGMDRGYEVDMFEVAYPDGYLLGDRVVTNTVVTHYYLKADKFKVGPRAVEKALTRIRMSFKGTDDNGRKMNAVLNFNMNEFSTRVDKKEEKFKIVQCDRDEDDAMFVTIGFTAEDAEFDLISEDIPSAVENARTFIKEVTDLPPARLPQVMVDFRDALYVTFYILERAPFRFDFDEPKSNTTIFGASEAEGITFLQDCAYKCLDSSNECWGFAHCGATCYIGTGNRTSGKLEKKSGCQFYNRTNMETVPRLKTIRRYLERAVNIKQPRLSVDKKGGGIITFTPSYIGDAVYGESEEIFDLMGMETNPRLRVVKVGHKLAANTGENIGKNFGKLTYGECQRLCLDYKACETVSYCLSSGECILSLTHAEDIGDTKFIEDNFCNVLTRKYADAFIRSPGDVLSLSARKDFVTSTEEDCAKACMKETSFDCLSFDSCPDADGKTKCRLHSVHILDLLNKEGSVSKESVCGHYSRKYTYDFNRQSKKKAVGNVRPLVSSVTVEQCAKYCVEYNQGQCSGFDSCQQKDMGSSCIILTQKRSEMKTTTDVMCEHFERSTPSASEGTGSTVRNSVARGVGFLLFVIGCVLGALIVYGISYSRLKRFR